MSSPLGDNIKIQHSCSFLCRMLYIVGGAKTKITQITKENLQSVTNGIKI